MLPAEQALGQPAQTPTGERVLGELALRTPLPFAQLLAYLRPRLIPGAETLTHDSYVRWLAGAVVRIGADNPRQASRLIVSARGEVHRNAALTAAARLFDPSHDDTAARQRLASCPVLGPRLRRVPGFRPLGSWSGFELCVRTLLGQQVSVAAAGTLIGRVVERCGNLTPERLAMATLADIGMPGRRVAALQALARAVQAGLVLDGRDWPDLDRDLATLPGFGPWTRAYLAIRLGRDPNAFPSSDLGLMRAAGASSPKALEAMAQAWRPHRALAATYLWAVPGEP